MDSCDPESRGLGAVWLQELSISRTSPLPNTSQIPVGGRHFTVSRDQFESCVPSRQTIQEQWPQTLSPLESGALITLGGPLPRASAHAWWAHCGATVVQVGSVENHPRRGPQGAVWRTVTWRGHLPQSPVHLHLPRTRFPTMAPRYWTGPSLSLTFLLAQKQQLHVCWRRHVTQSPLGRLSSCPDRTHSVGPAQTLGPARAPPQDPARNGLFVGVSFCT